MESILALVLIPWVFYVLILLFVIGIIYVHESKEDSLGWGHTWFILAACLIGYKFSYLLSDIKADPWIIVKYLGSYLLLGVIWAFVKWYFYLKNILNRYESAKQDIINSIKDKVISEEDKKIYIMNSLSQKYITGIKFHSKPNSLLKEIKIGDNIIRMNEQYTIETPSAAEHKSLILSWISHWPVSLLWTMINDPIKKLLNGIFNQIKNSFEGISNKIFKNTLQDFK